MKFKISILFLYLNIIVQSQGLPNDCIDYIQVCGNYDISLNVSGYGIQELGSNACSSEENNSLWLRVTIQESGTLGFTLTPESSSIEEDYDFWVFGPDVTCGNLGDAIRCSTTNPQNAGQGNNLTGLNESSTDISEGPGADGDSFVKWLDVVAGETYFFVIDRPIGYSPFNLTWTGTAVLDNPLLDYSVYGLEEISICDANNDQLEEYDFSIWNASLVDRLDGLEISYHTSESDANVGINSLSYPDTIGPGTYYARIRHENSNCLDIVPFQVSMNSFELSSLEVINENQIIAHYNFVTQDPVYFSLNNGEWQTSNIFSNVPPGAHTVQMQVGDCAIDELSTYIFTAYNVITPNGDGLNDIWELKGIEDFTGTELYIYDRYGKQLLHNQGEKEFKWDGTYNGQKLPSGSYWYILRLPDGRFQQGHITLINY